MPNIGPLELGIVLIVALIILGPKKLPDMGRSLGKGMREFKSAISGDDDDRAPALVVAHADDVKPVHADDVAVVHADDVAVVPADDAKPARVAAA
jgi:sec-independent protein translocase protein TatA